METELWVAIGVILTAIVGLVGHYVLRPKILAEAKKAEADAAKAAAEAAQINWTTLSDEIERLGRKVVAQGKSIEELETSLERRAEREGELERENRSLRALVRRLEKRVRAMEDIFKIGPISPAMQAELDKLKDE